MNQELSDAIYNDNLEKVKEIITKNPDILYEKIHNLYTPLVYACYSCCSTTINKYKIIEFLLKNGADINSCGRFATPLHALFWQLQSRRDMISEEAVIEIVKILIKYGANPNIKDKHDRTPICFLLKAYKKNGEENIRKTLVKIAKLLSDNNLIDLNTLEPKYKLLRLIFQYEKNREIEKLKKEIKKLKKKNEELRYAPGNAGYFEAMDDFDKLRDSKKNEIK